MQYAYHRHKAHFMIITHHDGTEKAKIVLSGGTNGPLPTLYGSVDRPGLLVLMGIPGRGLVEVSQRLMQVPQMRRTASMGSRYQTVPIVDTLWTVQQVCIKVMFLLL